MALEVCDMLESWVLLSLHGWTQLQAGSVPGVPPTIRSGLTSEGCRSGHSLERRALTCESVDVERDGLGRDFVAFWTLCRNAKTLDCVFGN